MGKKMRKCFAIICIALIMVSIWPVQRNAEAIVPVLAAEMVPAAATLLVAAGASFATVQAAQDMASWWYSEAGQDVRDALQQGVTSAVDGVMTVTDNLWTSVRDWVQSRLTVGENVVDAVILSGEQVITDSVEHWFEFGPVIYLGFQYTDTTYKVFAFHYELEGDTIKIYKEDVTDNPGQRVLLDEKGSVSYAGSKVKIYESAGKIYAYLGYVTSSGSFDLIEPWQYTEVNTEDYVVSTSQVVSITCTGADVLTNPTWDFVDESTGTREIGIPPVIDDVIGKTYTDVIDGVGTGTDTTADTGTIIDSINKFFDLEQPVNLEPLRVSGEVFTTKFPFSLPWDLKNSFTVFMAEGQMPIMHYDFSDKVPGMVLDIDLSMWQDIVNVVKSIELLLFDVGLILVTRRLLGGDV